VDEEPAAEEVALVTAEEEALTEVCSVVALADEELTAAVELALTLVALVTPEVADLVAAEVVLEAVAEVVELEPELEPPRALTTPSR
jgi:hypothetical protein